MKNLKTIGFLFLNTVAILALVSGPYFEMAIPTAQANAYCSGASVTVTVQDITSGQTLGSWTKSVIDPNDIGEPRIVDLTVPYGHVLHYGLGGVDPGSTPSFTAGKFYVDGEGNHYDEHTWSPGATYNMTGDYTAPAIHTPATFIGQKAENVCTPDPFSNPPMMGGTSAAVEINLNTSGGGVTNTITRTGNSNLAVFDNPQVDLEINDPGFGINVKSAPVAQGTSTINISWTTQAVNPGSSCSATNSNNDASWNGPKNGPGGGSQGVGPFNAPGDYTYNIVCDGDGGPSTVSTVHFIVGNTPSYTCSATPDTQNVNVGSDGAAVIAVTPVNGYNSPVSFSANVLPNDENKPTVSFDPATNPQNSPYDVSTVATISTTSDTRPGLYTITFTGTGGVGCRSIKFNVDAISPDAQIQCDTPAHAGPCHVSSGGSTMITWGSSYVNSCTVTNSPPSPPATFGTGLSGSKSTGPLSVTTTYDLSCSGTYGNVTRQLQVIVDGGGLVKPSANADNHPCGTANITWVPGQGGSQPKRFKVYRSLSNGNWGSPVGSVDFGQQYIYHDNHPLQLDVTNYYGVTAADDSTETTQAVAQIVPISCVPSLNGSDKDLIGLEGRLTIRPGDPQYANTFRPIPCSDNSEIAILPNNALFVVGDKVTFQINICNPGDGPLTGVHLIDTMHNLTNPSSFDSFSSYGGACISGNPSVSGNTININFSDVPNGSGTQYCSVTFKAIVTPPSNPTTSIFRFQNEAVIFGSGLTKHVYTPPYLFNTTGIPNRNETAPQ